MRLGSPYVHVEEYDKSFIEQQPTDQNKYQQFIIKQQKGRLNTPILIKSVDEFTRNFGAQNPNVTGHISTLVAYNFITKYPQWIIRVQKNQQYQNVLIFYDSDNEEYQSTSLQDVRTPTIQFNTNQLIFIRQKDPGSWGNALSFTLKQLDQLNGEIPLFKLSVFYDGVKVEEFTFTFVKNVQDNTGQSLFVDDVVNQTSNYVQVLFRDDLNIDPDAGILFENVSLENGNEEDFTEDTIRQELQNGNTSTLQVFIDALDILKDDETYEFDYIFSQGWTIPQIQQKMIEVQTQVRKIQILDQPDTSITDVVQQRVQQQFDTSYAQMFAPWLLTYNPFDKRIIKVPPTYFVQRKLFDIDLGFGYHYQVAGFTRGEIQQLNLQRKVTKQERDQLYNEGINPIQKFQNGIFIWGNKTLQILASKMDRLTSRRLVSLGIIKKLKHELRQFLFRPYTVDTLRDINNYMNQFIDSLRQSGQVEDINFRLIYTPELRDRNSLIIELNLIPTGTLEYITVKINIFPSTGITVQEV